MQGRPPARRRPTTSTIVQRRRRRRRRPNPLRRVVVACLLLIAVVLASYLLLFGFDALGRDVRGAVTQLFPPAASPTPLPTPSPTPTPEPTPTPVPTPEPTPTPTPLPILVNRQRPVSESYVPDNLVLLTDLCPTDLVRIKEPDTLGDRQAVEALIAMLRGGTNAGIGNWQISAGYRTYAYQQQLFDQKVADLMRDNGLSREKAMQAATKTVAPAGASEHHTGLAFDITVPGVSFAGTPQAKWLAQHCQEYGFILRYQAHKELLTGYLAEAWHFRYVGRDVAETTVEQDWCLEEYIDYFSPS